MSPDRLLQAFDARVRESPGAPLVVAPRRTASRAEVDAAARAAGRALTGDGDGPRPGEAVALQAPNGPAFLAGLVALRRARCAALLLDPRTPPLERERVAGQLGARLALVAPGGWAAAPGEWRRLRVSGAAGPPPPEGTAVVKLTSGSTGRARGVATPAEALLADDEALVATMGIRADDRLLAAIPLSHSYGLSSLAMPALVRGLPLVLPDDEGPFAPLAAAAAAEATFFPTVPAWLAGLARLAEPPPLPPSVRLVIAAGAPLAAEVSARFRARLGRPVHVFYGASESGGICYDRAGGAAERGTVGAPVDGVEIELVPLAGSDGDGGRVAVRSPAVAPGYLPASPDGDVRLAAGRFLTDDLGAWRDGELALSGRLDEVINVKGKKVDPHEVERVLGELSAVDEVVVTAAAAAEAREPVVRAVIACRPGSLSPEQVVAWCRERLADHKVPRSVLLVDALPRTERGKLDRGALATLTPRERLEGAGGAGRPQPAAG